MIILYKKNIFFFIFFILLLFPALPQSLFEEAEGTLEDDTFNFQLNGIIKSMIYAGKQDTMDTWEIKKGAGELTLKAEVSRQEWGRAYAECLFQEGYEFGETFTENVILKEAYVSLFYGPLDVIMGQQIVSWGKADAFNPTDNITPKKFLSLSEDLDDRRIGNFLIRAFLNLRPLRIEGIWVPLYEASPLPAGAFSFPSNIIMDDPDFPGHDILNSGVAVKARLELPAVEASVSYFNGFYLQPGIEITEIAFPMITVRSKAFRTHIIGADFSTTIGDFMGIRGEAACRLPEEEYEDELYVPQPDIACVLGVDKTFFSELSIIVQYMGAYVFDFSEYEGPLTPESMISEKNSLLFSQTHEISHSILVRAGWTTLYETLNIDLLTFYNITTTELLVSGSLGYDITDAFTISLGGTAFSGEDDTLFGYIDELLSSVYAELTISF